MYLRRMFVIFQGLFMFATGPSWGHDFWIEPHRFHTNPSETLAIDLLIGERFRGDAIIPAPRLVAAFRVHQEGNVWDVVQLPHGSTAGLTRIRERGLAVVEYQGHPKPIVLKAPVFNQYLQEEGLDHVLAARAAKDQTQTPGRESYARCAKALIRVGQSHDGWNQRLGHRLEFVFRTNPFDPSGETVAVLLFEGEPLAGTKVVAMAKNQPGQMHQSRTDPEGEVRFHLSGEGPWLLKTVHMVPHPEDGTDWSSVWASITFAR